ncbi:MAG: calcium-binding protein [Gemmataceae bacterium]
MAAPTFTGLYTGVESFIGGGTASVLVGPNAATTWRLTGTDAGTVNTATSFQQFAVLVGGSGADAFQLTAGAGVSGWIDGGLGVDTLDYSLYTTPIEVNRQTGTATGAGVLVSVEGFVGGSAIDTLIGPDAANVWHITGANAGDLNGGTPFSGFETLVGGSAADTFAFATGGSVTAAVSGQGGANTLSFAAVATPVTVNLQTSTATGVGSFTGIGAVVGGSAADTLLGANVSSTWDLTGGGAGTVNGLSFSGFDHLTAGSADDLFQIAAGGALAGTLIGGGGTDTLTYAAWTTPVGVNLKTGTATALGGVGGIERLRGGTGNDSLTGSDAGDVLDGGPGNDVLNGGGGSDELTGGPGNDVLNGGLGIDVLIESGDVSLTLTATALTGGLGADTLTAIEQARLTGGAGNNVLNAAMFPGAVTLDGGDGADTLTGGLGADVLIGGPGNDRLMGGAGVDLVIAAGGSFVLSATSLSGQGSDTLAGVERATLTGDGADNTFTVSGWSGVATLDGAGGTDLIVSSNNANFTLTDTSLTRSTGGNFTLVSIEAASLTGGAGNNVLNAGAFTGRLTLNGAGGNDILTGGSGPNVLLGGAGNDTLTGGASRDLLIGGSGIDRLFGGGDDDLLIGGTTLFYTEATSTPNLTALDALMAEWTSTADYATRIAHLQGAAGGLNGTFKLTAATVGNDNAVDTFTGGLGLDWFLASTPDSVTDQVTGTETRTNV